MHFHFNGRDWRSPRDGAGSARSSRGIALLFRWGIAAGCALAHLALSSTPASSTSGIVVQDPPCADLVARVSAVSDRGFTAVSDVEELRGGLLAVLDRSERHVYLLSEDLRYQGPVASHGEGPGEYMLPSSLSRLGRDSVALYDSFLGRLSVIRRDGTVVPTSTLRAISGAATGSVDGLGRAYRTIRAGRPAPNGDVEHDYDRILRWDRELERWDTAVQVSAGRLFEREAPQLARNRIAFRPVSTWAVAEDGVIAVVTAQPYQLRLYFPDGRMVESAEVEYTRTPVTDAQKDAWREARGSARPMEVGRVGAPPGSSRVEVMSFPSFEPAEWADFLPPFSGRAARFAPDGTLWIDRNVDIGSEGMVDVFGRDATCQARIRLPVGAQLVGIGETGVYVTMRDKYDLEYIYLLRVR